MDLILNKSIPVNLNFVENYIEVKEFIQFFKSFRRITFKRKYYEVAEKLLGDFLIIIDASVDNIKILDDLIGKNRILDNKFEKKSKLVDELCGLSPKGFELLNISKNENNFNTDQLKRLYKTASKKHHPDLGGKTEDMKLLNDTFSLFHEYLSREQNSKFREERNNSIENYESNMDYDAKSFMLEVYLCLIEVKIDINSFHEAQDLINQVKDKNLNLVKNFRELRDLYSKAGKLKISLNPLKELNLKSIPGVDYAFINSCIDEIQYLKLHEQLISCIEEDKKKDYILRDFYKEFKPLDFDLMFDVEPTDSKYIPYPIYSNCKFQLLDNAQKFEYLNTFGPLANFNNVEKYKFVRISSILANCVYFSTIENLEKSITELDFLLNVTDDYGKEYFQALNLLKSWLKRGENEFIERANLLKDLNDLYYVKPDSIIISFNNDGCLAFNNMDGFTIDCWQRSHIFMDQPLGKLVSLVKSKKNK